MEIVYPANCVLPSRSANTMQITKMCQAFVEHGHDVTLLVPDHASNEAEVDDIYEFYDVDPCFEIRKVQRPPLSSVGTFLVNYWMGREAAAMDPDLVYGRTVVSCYFAARAGTRTVLETHSPVRESRFGRVLDGFFRRLTKQPSFDYLVVISDALGNYYQANYPRVADRIVLARDASDPIDDSVEPAELSETDERLQVGYVGHLYQGRGMGLIAELAERLPEVDFHIIGGDPEDISYWKERLSSLWNITFHGFVPPSELDSYRLAFDAQLAPYQWDLETNAGHNTVRWMSPLKLFEYMAAGRAIVASDLPAIREILDDGRTALLCNPEAPDEWEQALRRIDTDNELRESLGQRAQSKFLDRYTYEKRAATALGSEKGPPEERPLPNPQD